MQATPLTYVGAGRAGGGEGRGPICTVQYGTVCTTEQ